MRILILLFCFYSGLQTLIAQPAANGVATPQQYGAKGDGIADDTRALRKCFQKNLNVRLYGKYRIADSISIQTGQRIYGDNAEIIYKTTTGKLLTSFNAHSWQIDGKLTLSGSGNTEGTAIALSITGGKNIQVSGLTITDISGTGIALSEGVYLQRGNCALMTNVSIVNSWKGLQTFKASEYHSFVNLNIVGCAYSAEIRSGNISLLGGNIVDNTYGLFIGGRYGTNNSHGIISGVNINHNKAYNLLCDSVQHGETFIGCHFFGQKTENIIIRNSKAVSFVGGIIDGRVEIADSSGYQYFNAIELGPSFNLYGFKERAIISNSFYRDAGPYRKETEN